jgi:uncharacterized protein (DUF983 family)
MAEQGGEIYRRVIKLTTFAPPEGCVMGMNVIVNDSTRWIRLIILCLIMLAISLVLLRWTRKLGWW